MSARKRKRFSAKLEDAELIAGYMVKHFVRQFLLVADDAGLFADSALLDQMSVKSLHDWLPDETSSMRPVWDRSVDWLRRVTGLSPFIVSCHACFAQALSPQQAGELLNADDGFLWSKVQAWETWKHDHPHEHDCWPPTLGAMI